MGCLVFESFFLQNAADSNFKKGLKNEHPNKLLALLVLTELYLGCIKFELIRSPLFTSLALLM